jgi:EmrB/QacA subfamily drug resistance transporter
MAREFAVPATDLSAALTAYLLALAIFIPASGRIADSFGAKTVFSTAIVVFMAGSIACGVAEDLPLLVAARFMQGVGGAMMTPIGRLVLLRSVAKEDMVLATSWLIMPAMIGPIVGPPLGGFIVTYLNWRWIFYLNIPVGLIGIVLVAKFIRQIRSESQVRPDLPGFALSALSLGSLLFGFEMTSRTGEGWRAALLIGFGAASGLGYVFYARRRADPILDLSLMAVPTFRLSVLAGSLTRITQGAQPFLLPLMFQLGFGMNAAASGALTVSGALGSIAMKGLAPRLLRCFGFRNNMIVIGLVASAGYAICGMFRPSWPVSAIFIVLMFSGFFMSFMFQAYNTIAYAEIEPDRMSAATSFYSTCQQLMLSLGICVGAVSLRLSQGLWAHKTPRLQDFSAAFLVVTAISALATIWHLQFSRMAGDELSGRSSVVDGRGDARRALGSRSR